MDTDEQEVDTIGMLLDIEHLYGEHSGRLGPVLLTLCICCLPILFYVYLGAFAFIPLWVAIPVELIICIRTIMIIPGRERQRLVPYKRRLQDDYTGTEDLMRIKTIHPDGCVEYINGVIFYLVVCFNGTSDSNIQRSIQLRKFLDNLVGDFEYDTYIHNINEVPALRDYYNKVNRFDKNQSARNFIHIIDHTLELTENTSAVQATIYAIKGYRSDWKTIKNQIDSTLSSNVARCYKSCLRVNEPTMLNDIINRNIDTVVNINALLRRKYATQQYDTSKVLAYDLPPDKEIIQGKGAADVVVNDVAPTRGFHVAYKEETKRAQKRKD